MKQIPLNTQLFSASLVDVSYTYTYDLHGHDKSVEVVLKAINTSDTIEAIFLLVNSYNEDEVDVTSQWHFSQEDGYSIAKKIFYETFNQTLIISVTSAQTEVNIAGGNNFPPESSKYGIHLNDDIQIGNTDVKISELVALVQQLKSKLEKTTKLVFHGNYQRGSISASTFTKGYFAPPSVINSDYLINNNGILTVQQSGIYKIEWNIRFPDTFDSTNININVGISIDEDIIDNDLRGTWSNYMQRGTSTGIICLYLSAGQTIRPKFWSSVNANLTGNGFYYITFMNYEVK